MSTNNTNNNPIARETVAYAAQCLRSGERALTLDAIHSEASGLKSEHQGELEQIIKGLGKHELSPRELNLAEDRMIGVLQPATWAFVQDEKLVASVLSYFHPYDLNVVRVQNTAMREQLQSAALGIVHTPHFRMHQQLLRSALASKTVLTPMEISQYRKLLRNLENPDQRLSCEEFFSCCPALQCINLDPPSVILLEQFEDSDELAKAMMKCCPKFKELYIVHYDTRQQNQIHKPLFLKALKAYASVLKKVVWLGDYNEEDMNAFHALPYLTDLELSVSEPVKGVIKQLPKFTGLERLRIRVTYNEVFAATVALSQLPLKELIFRSEGTLLDPHLVHLSKMTQLQKIDISDGQYVGLITYDGLKQFILARRATLKEIVLPEPCGPGSSYLRRDTINRLKAEFPDILIKYLWNKGYATAVPIPQAPGEED